MQDEECSPGMRLKLYRSWVEQQWSSSRGLLLLLQNPAEASSHTQLGGHPAPPPSDATTQNRENAECGRNAARQAGRGGRGGGRGRQAPSRRELQNSASSYAADTLLPCSAGAAVILCQFCKYKYTNTNTSTQIQIHKYEYTNTQTKIQNYASPYAAATPRPQLPSVRSEDI